jgi:hypothetical protein
MRSPHHPGAWYGIAALVCYFAAAFAPLPDAIGNYLGLAFGPLFMVSFLGIWRALAPDRDGLALRSGVASGVVASAIVTALLTIQIGNRLFLHQSLQQASAAEEQKARMLWETVNRVQLLMDVSWDIFLCLAAALISVSLLKSPRFRGWLGWTGLAASVLLLVLNLCTFPVAPADAGLVDAGPLLALWFAALYIALLRLPPRGQERPAENH